MFSPNTFGYGSIGFEERVCSSNFLNEFFLTFLGKLLTVFDYVMFVIHGGFFLLVFRPQTLLAGMNEFLASLDVTFRRDPDNFRPRINKKNSVKDTDQKRSGNYFFLED